jgi:hypothetical protein
MRHRLTAAVAVAVLLPGGVLVLLIPSARRRGGWFESRATKAAVPVTVLW